VEAISNAEFLIEKGVDDSTTHNVLNKAKANLLSIQTLKQQKKDRSLGSPKSP